MLRTPETWTWVMFGDELKSDRQQQPTGPTDRQHTLISMRLHKFTLVTQAELLALLALHGRLVVVILCALSSCVGIGGLLLIILVVLFLFVCPHVRPLSSNDCGEEQSAKTERHQIKESWLGVLEDEHDRPSGCQTQTVSNHGAGEVDLVETLVYVYDVVLFLDRSPLQTLLKQMLVKSEAHGYEYPRYDDVPKAQDGLLPRVKRHRENKLSRALERFSDSDHDVGSEDPEDVINKQTTQQNECDLESPQ
mmetsp:Transcript_31601/g.91549  ORF Transcript_31601/g.91549 Transcript_31601/m.91549 type:complete len:250 (+) Transcript_31601:604-1353(+)